MGSLTVAAIGTVVTLGITTAATAPTDAAPRGAAPGSRSAAALGRLVADTRGSVRVSQGPDGLARVVSVDGESRPPTAIRALSPRAAARAQLTRYGALVGVGRPGTRLVGGTVLRTVTGDRVVHFAQRRGGLPVVAGAVAVDLRPDRSLASITASVSTATVPGATYSGRRAAHTALAVALKTPGHPARADLRTSTPVRKLWDPAALGIARTSDPRTAPRGVWQVVVSGGPGFRRSVLVDDRTGVVVLDVDRVEQLDRVVCDDGNTIAVDAPCTQGFARTETGPASALADVNEAFELGGVVARFYQRIGGLDLTQLLGVDVAGQPKLAATVRFCALGLECPMQNAFWNGQQMFYGEGFAGADDVVGHEMTHGVIDHSSRLFYWGQSGAMNESLADVMGEIIDHRHASPGDSPHSWTIGEDLPIGAVRDLSRPGRFGQPDRMTGAAYVGEDIYNDNDGVHTDSGVGNRTFYLISQGGTQDGHVVRGIDHGPMLTKTAMLALSVIQHLVSGSDYADLAAQLEQSCHALARHGTVGFTAADCRSVHQATLATELRVTPPSAPQPKDAPMTCPRGTGPVRVLFDSETGRPTTEFVPGPTWSRAPSADAPANATSGLRSWFSTDPENIGTSSVTMARPHALPAGRPAFLWFHQWRVLDFILKGNFDGGTVELADDTTASGMRGTASRPWVNGPHDRLRTYSGNPAGGRLTFSRDSHGWTASRMSLTSKAGHAVRLQFTMNTDNSIALPGWFLDDVRVYSCGRGPMPRSAPTIRGTVQVGSTLVARPGAWTGKDGHTFAYRWYADGAAIAGARRSSYLVKAGDAGKRLTVEVTATSRTTHEHTATFSAATPPVAP